MKNRVQKSIASGELRNVLDFFRQFDSAIQRTARRITEQLLIAVETSNELMIK
jgi:hypothetical protein